MRYLRVLVLVSAACLVTGCDDLLSLHSLYMPEDRVFDVALEGRWENDVNQLVIVRDDDGYAVTLISKKSSSVSYEVHFVDIEGVRFADVLKAGTIGHMFLRVRTVEAQLHLAFFDSEWLRERIPHEEADGDRRVKRAVLTAGTSQLRSLVARYAKETKAYDVKELVFRRSEWLS